MKTLSEALEVFKARNGATTESVRSKWSGVRQEVFDDPDARVFVAAIVNQFPDVVALLQSMEEPINQPQGMRLVQGIMTFAMHAFCNGLCVGIEMERADVKEPT